jgi:anthranilate phosphoribosyltransferase
VHDLTAMGALVLFLVGYAPLLTWLAHTTHGHAITVETETTVHVVTDGDVTTTTVEEHRVGTSTVHQDKATVAHARLLLGARLVLHVIGTSAALVHSLYTPASNHSVYGVSRPREERPFDQAFNAAAIAEWVVVIFGLQVYLGTFYCDPLTALVAAPPATAEEEGIGAKEKATLLA